MKKVLKIAGIVFLLLIVALFAIPFFFKDAIKEKVVAAINKNLDATVSFEDVDLSLFRSFPQASVKLDKLMILNKAPFAGDTLLAFGQVSLDMSVKELFKGKDEPIQVESVSSRDGLVNIIFNKDGLGNFDIALKNAKEKDNGKSDPLSLKVKQYKIENFKFRYTDENSKMKLRIDSLYHSGTGDFAAKKLDLVTRSSARVSLDMDKVNYMNKVPLTLNATLGIDMENQQYTFKQNKALINKLPLEFDGSIKILESGQQYDLTFKTPSAAFTNFLGLIPSAYSGSLANVKTTGNFTVSGFAKGVYADATVPKFNIAIASNDASFQYPNLPKAVRHIVIDTKIVNDTGVMNDTYVDLEKLSFAIDQDVFNAKATIRNVATNALVDAKLNGTVNLGNLSKAYPIKMKVPMSGILKADVATNFDMQSVEKSQYQNIRNSGSATLSGFRYTGDDGKTFTVSNAAVQFNPNHINLNQFNATTGKSDLALTGTLDNFYGFLFKDQTLKGNFNLSSNQLAVSDFMTEEKPATKTTAKKQPVKIPAFLDCTVSAKANTVLYDNLVLKNVSGNLAIRDQQVTLTNLKTNMFGGLIGVSGNVSTKNKVPTFDMNLNLNQVDIAQTFTQLDMMRNIAPIAGVVNGKLNSGVKVSGNLDALEMTPDLKTINGNMTGELLSTTVNPTTSSFLTSLDNSLNFIDLSKINLNDLKAALTFSNGRVNLKPVTLKYKDIAVQFNGSHGFDQSLDYNMKFDVPAKYLGTQVNALLAKLTPAQAQKIDEVPISARLTGNFKNPKIQTDVKQAVSNLTMQLVKAQRDQLVQQGTSALGNILHNATQPKNPKDTTKTKQPDIKQQAGQILNGLFNKKKSEKKEPAK